MNKKIINLDQLRTFGERVKEKVNSLLSSANTWTNRNIYTEPVEKTGSGLGYMMKSSDSTTMMYASTTGGEHLFGGNNDGSETIKDYLRVGVNKLSYQTNGSIHNIYHEGHKPTPHEIGALQSQISYGASLKGSDKNGTPRHLVLINTKNVVDIGDEDLDLAICSDSAPIWWNGHSGYEVFTKGNPPEASEVSAVGAVDYSGGKNLNSVARSEIGCCMYTSNATYENNYPLEEAGSVLSMMSAYGAPNQMYTSYNSNRIFFRGSGRADENRRTSWAEVITSNNVVIPKWIPSLSGSLDNVKHSSMYWCATGRNSGIPHNYGYLLTMCADESVTPVQFFFGHGQPEGSVYLRYGWGEAYTAWKKV